VATARKLVTIAFLMLKNDEPYRYAKPETVKSKLAEARRKAGRKAAGEGQSGRGKRAEAAGALNEVYERAGLPATRTPEQLPAGERRALQEAEVVGFVEEVHRPGQKRKAGKRAQDGEPSEG
jgi:transposase